MILYWLSTLSIKLRSMMLDAVLPLKSMLTKGLSLVARIPFKCDLEALMISALTSSRLNSFLVQK